MSTQTHRLTVTEVTSCEDYTAGHRYLVLDGTALFFCD
ncbi:hypothetical protein QF037_009075 [Streptomyces canus]|nr:hypothetical protein [Streptomyces canus]